MPKADELQGWNRLHDRALDAAADAVRQVEVTESLDEHDVRRIAWVAIVAYLGPYVGHEDQVRHILGLVRETTRNRETPR